MIDRLIYYVFWRVRNHKMITLLQDERDRWLRKNHKQMWCELHGSYDCPHSTWNGEHFRKENAKAHQWYSDELTKLD